MTAAAEFIANYDASAREQINFAWNGKHATEFRDSNQEFRWQVVSVCIAEPERASLPLLEDLFLADAAWAGEAWGAPHHFAKLGGLLLECGQEAALDSFSKGFVRSFDTFGACHEMQISTPLLVCLVTKATAALSLASEGEHRKRLEAVLDLFAKMENRTATQGWAKVAPGTPVSNIRVVWPRWYHKLWARIISFWSHLTSNVVH